MSKPMELITFPPIHRPRYGYGIDPYQRQWKRERAIIEAKRFTDAELAAEAWAAQCNRRVRNYDNTRDIPGVTWEWEHMIMARFATLPNYDEADA
jgi:hypothetical protein